MVTLSFVHNLFGGSQFSWILSSVQKQTDLYHWKLKRCPYVGVCVCVLSLGVFLHLYLLQETAYPLLNTSTNPVCQCFIQNYSSQTELQDHHLPVTLPLTNVTSPNVPQLNPPSIVYKIWKNEQQLGGLTRLLVLTKFIIFEGEKQTAINWECATNSYGNKVSKYQIMACASQCLLTRFALRMCKAAPATLLHPWSQGTPTEIWILILEFSAVIFYWTHNITVDWFALALVLESRLKSGIFYWTSYLLESTNNVTHYDLYLFLAISKWMCNNFTHLEITRGQGTKGQAFVNVCFLSTLLGYRGHLWRASKRKKQKPLNLMQISQNREAQCGVIRSVRKHETQYLGALKQALCSRLYGRSLSACRHKLDYHVWWLSSLWIGGSEREGFTNTCIQGADPPTHIVALSPTFKPGIESWKTQCRNILWSLYPWLEDM